MKETMLHQASLSGFIRTVFIILLVWYVIRLLARFLAPYLVKKVIQRATANFSKNYKQESDNQQNKYKKNTSDNSTIRKKYRSTKKIGEYIDYEEID